MIIPQNPSIDEDIGYEEPVVCSQAHYTSHYNKSNSFNLYFKFKSVKNFHIDIFKKEQ